jgi:hypothetical protein
MVFTARFAASRLGVDIDVIEEMAEQMAHEDAASASSIALTRPPRPSPPSRAKASITSTTCSTSAAQSS